MELPQNRCTLPCRWFFRLLETSDSASLKYKVRIVAKGFRPEHRVNLNEILMATAFRFLLGIFPTEDLEHLQLDVKMAFLRKAWYHPAKNI